MRARYRIVSIAKCWLPLVHVLWSGKCTRIHYLQHSLSSTSRTKQANKRASRRRRRSRSNTISVLAPVVRLFSNCLPPPNWNTAQPGRQLYSLAHLTHTLTHYNYPFVFVFALFYRSVGGSFIDWLDTIAPALSLSLSLSLSLLLRLDVLSTRFADPVKTAFQSIDLVLVTVPYKYRTKYTIHHFGPNLYSFLFDIVPFGQHEPHHSLNLELEQWNRRSSTPVANHNFSGPIGAPGTLNRSGGPSPSCSPGHSNNLGNPNVNSVPHPMLCGPPPLPPQNGPPMTMGPYNPGANSIPHVMHHPPHPMQHPTGPPPPPNHMQPPHGRHTPFYEMRQPEFRIFEMNKRLLQRSDESDNLWWDAFSTEFFEDDATLTVTFCLEDGPKRYTIGRTLIPRYFRSIFEGGVTELQINLKHFKESYHTTTITLDCDQSSIITYHGKTNYKLGPYPHPQNDPMKDQIMKENSVFVCTEGRLILEFMFDDCMRIKSWHFSTRHHQELISRGLVAMQQAQQDPAMMEQLTKNITRQGLTNSTLNYLRLCVILEPMQELMSRHKAYALSPRDCLKTTLFQKWQRMVAPPETSRPPSKRRKRKSSTNAGTTTNSKKKNNQNNMSPVPPPFTLATQDVMVVGEPSLMGGEFGDEDERLITRLENNQYDPSAASGTNGLEDADDFNSLGSSTSGGTNVANNGGNNSAGIIGPGTNGGPPNWPPNGSNNSNNTNGANSGPPQGANGPIPGPPGPNGPNSQDDSKKQSPNLSQ